MTDKNQEDIDKTLDQKAGMEDKPVDKEQEITESVQEEVLSDEDIDTLGEIGNIFMGSASTTLSTLLKNKVEITTPQVEMLESIDKTDIMKKNCVLVEINYTQGFEGKVVFVLKKEDAAVIADIMTGGTGIPADSELDEMKISAIGEAMTQMVGTASTALSNMLNNPITITPPEVKLFDKEEEFSIDEDLGGKKIINIKFNLKVGDLVNSEIIQFMSVDAAKSQVKDVTDLMKDVSENLRKNSPQSIIDELTKEEEQPENDFATMSSPISSGAPQSQNQVTVQPVQFASFDNSANIAGGANQNLNLVMDVSLGLTVELGRTELPIKNVLELTRGSIIELDKVAGEPVELYANGKLIAKGEVVVIEDNFGLRITSIISPEQRIKHI